jgi:two-component system, NtrC family, sensor histidine kinase PilS
VDRDASRSLVDAARPGPSTSAPLDSRRRRIQYFMLVRLVVLALFTVMAGVLAWRGHDELEEVYGIVGGTIVLGYGLTIVYAWLLPRVRDLDRLAWLQTTIDILLATVVVQMTGGTGSGFVSLYLIAVLGAATMAGGRQTWAAAGACALIYGATSLLEGLRLLEPFSLGQSPPLGPAEVATACASTLLALLGVTALSSYLDKQLASSTLQVGDLRALNENVLRSLASGLVGVANDGRVIYWNPAAQAILGLDASDLQRPAQALLPGVEARLEAAGRWELEVQTRAGHPVHLGLHCSPLLDGQGRAIGRLINFQDVTRIHELAEQVRRNERLAAVGGLAASVAHEIRNPLAAISGSAELLGSVALEDDDARLLSIIRRESTRLSELVTDMLAFTRPRPPQRARVSLPRVAREALEHFRADPANAGLELKLHADDDVPDVEVDAAQLIQVLWNLLRNAAEAMGGTGTVTLEVRARPGHGHPPNAFPREAELAVGDEGPGIPSEQLERIFDPFFTTKERGTGFGLAIVHRIVHDNGGAIELSSTPGHGTVFRLRFPALETS